MNPQYSIVSLFVSKKKPKKYNVILMIHDIEMFQYAGINIGPVHKKDIMKASVMLEHDSQ